MSVLRREDQYHVGIVVADFQQGLERLTALFGHEWSQPYERMTKVRVPSGETEIPLHFVYSTTTPRLEVIEAIPGTVWQPSTSGLHHFGFWCDDVPGAAAELEAEGLVLEASGIGPDGQPYWAYLRREDGPRIELVSRALEPSLEQMWAVPRSP